MKKIIIMLVVGLFAGVLLAQTNDYSIRSVRDPVQLEAKLDADMSAIDTRIDSLEAEVIAQRDTNTTTSVTLYSASRAGQLLAGSVGGSNAIWVASASGTNSWVKVIQK